MATKNNLKDRMKKRRKALEERGKGGIWYPKEGTYRIRILDTGEDKDFIVEVDTVYLGKDLGGTISPSTFGLPCAFKEKQNELRQSNKEADKELLKQISFRKKALMLIVRYKDMKGKEIDEENSPSLMQISADPYAQIIDLFLDEEDWGDVMTDPEKGFDLKFIRTGSGKNDTSYNVQPLKNTPLPTKYHKIFDLEAEIKRQLPTYDDTVELLDKFLSGGVGEEEEEKEKRAPRRRGTGDETTSKTSRRSRRNR